MLLIAFRVKSNIFHLSTKSDRLCKPNKLKNDFYLLDSVLHPSVWCPEYIEEAREEQVSWVLKLYHHVCHQAKWQHLIQGHSNEASTGLESCLPAIASENYFFVMTLLWLGLFEMFDIGNRFVKKYFNELDATLVRPTVDREWELPRRRMRVVDGMLNA